MNMEWNIRLTSSANLSSRLCTAYENIVTSRMILTSKSQSSCSVNWTSISRGAVAWPQIRWPPVWEDVGSGQRQFTARYSTPFSHSPTLCTLCTFRLPRSTSLSVERRLSPAGHALCDHSLRPLPRPLYAYWSLEILFQFLQPPLYPAVLLGISRLRVCEAMSLDWSKPMRYVTTSVFSRVSLGHWLVI